MKSPTRDDAATDAYVSRVLDHVQGELPVLLLFLHITKNAGTYISGLLSSSRVWSPPLRLAGPNAEREKLDKLLRAKSGLDGIVAHVGDNFTAVLQQARAAPKRRLVVLLPVRDPVERVISEYTMLAHVRTVNGHSGSIHVHKPPSLVDTSITLDAWMRDPNERNHQAGVLAGYQLFAHGGTQADLEEWMGTMETVDTVLVTTGAAPLMLRLLQLLFPGRAVPNATAVSARIDGRHGAAKRQNVSEAQRRQILALNELDERLYDLALQHEACWLRRLDRLRSQRLLRSRRSRRARLR